MANLKKPSGRTKLYQEWVVKAVKDLYRDHTSEKVASMMTKLGYPLKASQVRYINTMPDPISEDED